MDRLGDDLLARAVLAQDQHGQIGVGHAADDRAEGLDGWASADQPHLLRRLLGDAAVGGEQLLPVLGVFQGHGRVRRQLAQRLLVVPGKSSFLLVDQLEGAEQFSRPAAHGDAQQRARLVAELFVDAAVDGPRLAAGVHPPGLAGVDHLAHDAAVVGDAEFAARRAQGRPADEDMVRLVPQKDAGPIGVQQPRGRFGHLDEQRFHFVGLVPLGGDFQHGLQPPQPAPIVRATANPVKGPAEKRRKPLDGCRCHRGILDQGKMEQQGPALFRTKSQGHGDPARSRADALSIERVGQQIDREGLRLARLGRDRPVPIRRRRQGDVVRIDCFRQ